MLGRRSGGSQLYLADRYHRFRRAYCCHLGSIPCICSCQIGRVGIQSRFIGSPFHLRWRSSTTKTMLNPKVLMIPFVGGCRPARTLLIVVRCMPVFADHATTPPARFTRVRSNEITSSISNWRIQVAQATEWFRPLHHRHNHAEPQGCLLVVGATIRAAFRLSLYGPNATWISGSSDQLRRRPG